jgi:hypothetical protein
VQQRGRQGDSKDEQHRAGARPVRAPNRNCAAKPPALRALSEKLASGGNETRQR